MFIGGITGKWGFLPAALPLAWIVVARLGTIGFADAPACVRLLGGATWALATFVVGVRLVGAVNGLRPEVMFGLLAVLAGGLSLIGRRAPLSWPWRAAVTAGRLPLLVLVMAALGLATVAAMWLPVWQWDALGYHLPFVDFALQRGSLDDVPADVPYLSTYPHNVELCFLAFRAMLPDDQLVELAHLPFGLLGALATTALARHWGARGDALLAGLSWIALPAVFLQLPTNYIDVACAALLLVASYWVLARPTARSIVCAGVALGLLLGSKPNAPVATSLLFAALAWRGWRAGLGRWVAAAALLTFALGAESYVHNVVRHHNPIWPVRLQLGPWELPGIARMQTLLDAGAQAPRVRGPLPWRLLVSWTSLGAPPVFDMRIGGLGALYPLALGVALVRVVQERSWMHLVPLAAALGSPDPAVARYVLALPALCFALTARSIEALGPRARGPVLAVVTGSAAWNVVYAAPGLAGDGPPLSAYARMTDRQRQSAVGADGPPTEILAARDRLRPGQAAAYDAAFDLPYLAWKPDLSTRVVRIPDDADVASAGRLIDDADVHLLLVDEQAAGGLLARSRPTEFVPLFPLEGCKSARCVAYFRP